MKYHLFQKFFVKMVKIKETSFLSTRGMTLMFGNCIALKISTEFQQFLRKQTANERGGKILQHNSFASK